MSQRPEPPPVAAPGRRRGRRVRRRRRHCARCAWPGGGAGALLALLTIATFLYQPRYEAVGARSSPTPISAPASRVGETEGLVTLDETELGHAMLQNWDPARAVFLRQAVALPEGRTSLRLSADIAVRRVERGAEDWQTARVYLVQQTAEGASSGTQATALANLIGTTARQHFEAVFEVPGTVPR